MGEWGVTSAGYELLEKTGLDKRINDNWEQVHMLVPRGAFIEQWEVEDTLKTPYSERVDAIKKWADKEKNFYTHPEIFLMASGKVTDAILTKDEIANPQSFGIKSLSELDGLLAAYALVKDEDDYMGYGKPYVWRSNEFRTLVYSAGQDGDLQIHQYDISQGTGKNSSLFGKLEQSHVNANYSYWDVLVGTALKYADVLEITIPEAENWRELLRNYGWNGDIKQPSLSSGGYENFVNDFTGKTLAQLPDKTNIRDVKKMFFGIMRPNANHVVSYIPVIDLNQDLVFYGNCSGDNISIDSIGLAPYGIPAKYRPLISIKKEDAPHLFKGAVHGIMTHQLRTPSQYLAYLLWEHDRIKEGKSADEIWDEGQKFERY